MDASSSGRPRARYAVGGSIPAINGAIIKGSPLIRARITRNGELELGRGRSISVCVDTGFTGDIALPRRILKQLKRSYAGPMDYQLADGSLATMDLWDGNVVVAGRVYPAVFIEGEFLLGMELIEVIGQKLLFNLDSHKVLLSLRTP